MTKRFYVLRNRGAKMKGEKMTKQKILDYLNNVLHPIISPDNWNIYSELYDMIEELPSAEPKTGEWIPFNEKLPREYAQYLVCFESGECYVYWLKDSDWVRDMIEKEGAIAWMPLPMPYREGREDYELATEQMEHDVMYEPTYNSEDGSM